MSITSKIDWCDSTWNPITGCSKISEGCLNCYANRELNARFKNVSGYNPDNPFEVTFHPERLNKPLEWKGHLRIFTVSMGDLFHEKVDPSWIDSIMSVITQAQNHIFLFLTKRPERMSEYFIHNPQYFDLQNLWFGVTIELQSRTNRFEFLANLPIKTKRFISFEPLLGPINIPQSNHINPDWVIAGGESGNNSRCMHEDWIKGIRDQCMTRSIPFFFKSWGSVIPETQLKFIKNKLDPESIDAYFQEDNKAYIRISKHGSTGHILDGNEFRSIP